MSWLTASCLLWTWVTAAPGVPPAAVIASPPAAPATGPAEASHRWRSAATLFERPRGVVLGAGVGLGHCLQRGCFGAGWLAHRRLRPGAIFRGELAWRPRGPLWIGVVGAVGVHPMKIDGGFSDPSGLATSWQVLANVTAAWPRLGPVTLLWELGFGGMGMQARTTYLASDGARRERMTWIRGPALQPAFGFLYVMGGHVALGASVAQALPLGHTLCRLDRPDTGAALSRSRSRHCSSRRDLPRPLRRSLPWPFQITLRVVRVF